MRLLWYLSAHVIMCNAANPLYDITQSFEYNYLQGPLFNRTIPHRTRPPRSQWHSLLGYPIASPIGIPACAIMTSKGIALMAQLGFDVLTYKTVSSHKVTGHDLPNICHVSCNHQLTSKDIGACFYATHEKPEHVDTITISNSLGNKCNDPDENARDISRARAALHEGQVLIVSVFGHGTDCTTIAQDFATTACMAYNAGAQIIELNLSCPNINHGLMYKDPAMVGAIVQCVHNAIPIPIIIKVGIFENKNQMREVLQSAAKAGARGVCGINTIPVKIITKDGIPFFGSHRSISGLSGAPLRDLAKQFIKDAHDIITQDKLDFTLIATGGITSAEHFQEFFDLGAQIALSGTGAMWNPYLGHQYHLMNQ